jgi:hypothetical protein
MQELPGSPIAVHLCGPCAVAIGVVDETEEEPLCLDCAAVVAAVLKLPVGTMFAYNRKLAALRVVLAPGRADA